MTLPALGVLVVDRQPVFRAGLRAIIAATVDLAWVGETGDADRAVAQTVRLSPDVVLGDPQLPDVSDGSLTRRIADAHPGAAILLVADRADRAAVLAAIEAGASGYVLKTAEPQDIVRAIRAVGHGDASFCSHSAQHLLDQVTDTPAPVVRAFPELTPREGDVLAELAHAASNGEIARKLGMSPKTVRNHVSQICNKLQVLDRAHAVLRARAAGLGPAV